MVLMLYNGSLKLILTEVLYPLINISSASLSPASLRLPALYSL